MEKHCMNYFKVLLKLHIIIIIIVVIVVVGEKNNL